MRQSNSILMSLTNACVLREGQLLEVPGLGNGTSICSDDSRLEDPPTTELLVLSPRHTGHAAMRSPPPVRCLAEPCDGQQSSVTSPLDLCVCKDAECVRRYE